MSSPRNPGRVAGLWYSFLVIIGPLRLLYIPKKIYVAGNAPATVNNIFAHQLLFRFGIMADLACAIVLVMLTLAFYRLFKSVDHSLAVQVVIFGSVMPATLYIVNVACDMATLMLVRGADFLSVFSKPQQDALAMLFLRLHGHQNTAAQVLWGVWLLPLGMLVYKSRFLPRFLGVWLFIDGLSWLALCFMDVMVPQYQGNLFLILQPAFFGEIALMLWLLIKGARPPALDAAAV